MEIQLLQSPLPATILWPPPPPQDSCEFVTCSIVAELLDEIQTKVLGVFLLAIQSHLYSFALRFLFLQTAVQLLYSTL
jgi:hypothetical protein